MISSSFQFRASLLEETKQYVHHIVIYTCESLDESVDLGPGGACHEQSENIIDCRGFEGVVIAAWAVGGKVQISVLSNLRNGCTLHDFITIFSLFCPF